MTNEQWTADVPTRPGVYKWKERDWVYAGQLDANGIMEINCRQLPAADWGGLWCGPLVPEAEVTEAYKQGYRDAANNEPNRY